MSDIPQNPPIPEVDLVDDDKRVTREWWVWFHRVFKSTQIISSNLLGFETLPHTWSALQQFLDGSLALRGLTSGLLTLKAAAVSSVSRITFPTGVTDFSLTGGPSQVVKQTSVGAAFTVAQLAASDMSNGTIGSGAVVLVNDPINSGFKVSTSTLTKTSDTALATIPGLSVALTAGKTYYIQGHLTGSSGAVGGIKLAMVASGGLTATSISVSAAVYNSSSAGGIGTSVALDSLMYGGNVIFTDIYIDGAIVVNAGGTINLQAAQTTSDGTPTVVLLNSTFSCVRVN
jgi:hypothetical protein